MKIEGATFTSTTPIETTPVKVQTPVESSAPATPQTSSSQPAVQNVPSKNSVGDDSYLEFARKPRQEQSMSEQEWIKLIERANKALNGANKSFEYSIHEATKQIMVKVIDKDTKEVIREIPSEKVLDMVAKMWEMAGLFVDERR